MSWLAPITAIYAAAIAVPLLVAMYFLKLKRRQMLISSTLLWKRAIQDLQVNAPFQKIRRNILLLLQLLAIAAAIAALGRPVISMTGGPPKRYVLLIDRSASMNATDVSPSRLELAKSQAKEIVGALRSRTSFGLADQSDQAMVIAFDEHAKVMCNFTSDKRQLGEAVDSIGPTDGGTSIAEAVAVARAYAQPPGEATNNRSSETPAQLELFSDGRIPDAEGVSVAQGEMNFHRVGKSGRNVAVTAMQARRSYERPEEIEVFATLANFGDRAAACDVQLSLDGSPKTVRAVQVPAKKPAAGKEAAAPGRVSVSFSLTHSPAGVLEVKAIAKDEDNSLSADDTAWAVLPAPRNLRGLLVTAGNAPLEAALKACPLLHLETLTPEQFDALDKDELNANPKWEVIILDNHSPAKLPRGRYIVFGRPPEASGVAAGETLQGQFVVDWRSRHPILQFVNLSNLYVSKCFKIVPPADGDVLAEFASAPALVLVRRGGSAFLLAPFDCSETNWPFEPSFVIFCYNAAAYLGLEAGLESPEGSGMKVNQAISLEALPPGAKVKVSGPGGLAAELVADASGSVRLPGTSRAGIYELSPAGRSASRFAVNILDEAESDIEPAASLKLAGQSVAAQDSVSRGNVEVWPLLAMLAMGLVLVEWFVYKRKVRV